MTSPFQFACAGVFGLVGSTRLLLTSQVFWIGLEDDVEDVLLVLLEEELLGVWVMVRRMIVESQDQMFPYWPAHLSMRKEIAACERKRKRPNSPIESLPGAP